MNTHYKIDSKAMRLANAFGFLFPGEVCLIQAIAQSLPEDAVMVNVGVGVGTGSLAMAEIHPYARIFSVDISKGGPEGGLENEVNAFKEAGFTNYPVQILGDSALVHESWSEISKDLMIDLLFIDGDHSESALQADIDGWTRFVPVGGYVLFHDYNSEFWQGVSRVVDRNMSGDDWQRVLLVDTLIAFRRAA